MRPAGRERQSSGQDKVRLAVQENAAAVRKQEKMREEERSEQENGYVETAADMYGRQLRRCCQDTVWAGKPLRFYQTLDSTNVRAAEEAENGAPQGTLIVADMQTAGRGRRGRAWESPAGVNLYFSLILKPDYPPDRASMVTLVMALAVAEGIREAYGAEAGIKWPNDIVMGGRKVCGILTELRTEKTGIRHIIIGVGINVGRQTFAPELADRATDLETACALRVPRAELLAAVLRAFEREYAVFVAAGDLSGLQEMYDRLCVNRGREVRVLDPQGEFQGKAHGISRTGELLVGTADGEIRRVYAGEVSVRGIYGYV